MRIKYKVHETAGGANSSHGPDSTFIMSMDASRCLFAALFKRNKKRIRCRLESGAAAAENSTGVMNKSQRPLDLSSEHG